MEVAHGPLEDCFHVSESVCIDTRSPSGVLLISWHLQPQRAAGHLRQGLDVPVVQGILDLLSGVFQPWRFGAVGKTLESGPVAYRTF